MPENLRIVTLMSIALGIGSTLLLSELRWFKRVPLHKRLAPFSPHGYVPRERTTSLLRSSAMTLWLESAGEWAGRLLGLNDNLSERLRRGRIDISVETFRLRQFAWSGGSVIAVLLVVLALRPPAPVALLFVGGAPLLSFLLLEQRVVTAARARQQRLFAELPVITEQLAMLLGAGYSLSACLGHIAQRSSGAISTDLLTVCERLREGLTSAQALEEWAEVVDVPEIHRLVNVLSLSSETSDLGRVVSEEARSIRREAQRRLVQAADKRNQQVWIPVTVATLVPGVIFLAIPFLQALRLFGSS